MSGTRDAWYVASLRDGDTHLGIEINGRTVSARCGQTLRPLARLTGRPPDPLQVCPVCAAAPTGGGSGSGELAADTGGSPLPGACRNYGGAP